MTTGKNGKVDASMLKGPEGSWRIPKGPEGSYRVMKGQEGS